MRGRTIFIRSAAILFLLCQMSTAGQKLRYNYEKGKTYTYSALVKSKTTGQAMGQEFTMTSGVDFDYSISLDNMNNGVMTLTVTFEKFIINLNIPMMGFNDSTVVMQEYVGKRMKVIATERGKTLSVEAIDTIPPSREQMMASVSPKDLLMQILLELPEKELDINSSWKKNAPDTTFRGGLKIVTKHNTDFTVVAAEKKLDLNCWKIAIQGTSTFEGSGSQRGADVALDGTVKVSGAAFIASAEGVFVFSEQSNETDMTTTATGSQTGASTMVISTTVKNTLVK